MNRSQPAAVVAYVGLGSNLFDPHRQIMSARAAIKMAPGIREFAFSSLYSSPPMGPPDQPDYVNAVMAVETTLSPMELLRALQSIESDHGRIRQGERWGPRTLDLDLLLYGRGIINLPELTVPHVGIGERAFVLYPLLEIAPEINIPGMGMLNDVIRNCPREGLRRLPG
ncbi:MAG: 2-amino-4-hydroxy-6-hydroxymethyldihydropteridine diphosphokinase [Pseudomonadota bacterium]